jgi:hypothetical protein
MDHHLEETLAEWEGPHANKEERGVTVIIFIDVGTYYEERWADEFPADAPVDPRLLA